VPVVDSGGGGRHRGRGPAPRRRRESGWLPSGRGWAEHHMVVRSPAGGLSGRSRPAPGALPDPAARAKKKAASWGTLVARGPIPPLRPSPLLPPVRRVRVAIEPKGPCRMASPRRPTPLRSCPPPRPAPALGVAIVCRSPLSHAELAMDLGYVRFERGRGNHPPPSERPAAAPPVPAAFTAARSRRNSGHGDRNRSNVGANGRTGRLQSQREVAG